MPGDFNRIGNLAFYNGWSPNYVYFKSLINAGLIYKDSNNNSYTSWDGAAASEVAKVAIGHAQQGNNAFGYNEDEIINKFMIKFQQIHVFLNAAIIYEQGIEKQFFKDKMKELESLFNKKELNEIKVLKDLARILDTNGANFNYRVFISLINSILSGTQNAKVIAMHESKRINKINSILDNLSTSRGNQVAGLYKKKLKDGTIEQEIAVKKAQNRLEEKITVEYLNSGSLTRKNKSGKYVLFGGKKFDTEVEKTVANTLADWSEEVLSKIIEKPDILQQIVTQIAANYPMNDGNFKHLEKAIREMIILGIIQYGLSDLNTVLNKNLNDTIVSKVETALTTDQSIFDTVANYNIHGLEDNMFGQRMFETNLFKDTHSIAEAREKNATQIYKQLKQLLEQEGILKKQSADQSSSFLVQALNHAHGKNTKDTALQQIEKMIELIESIQTLVDEAEELRAKQQKSASKNIDKTLFVNHDKNLPLTVTIHNGEIEIDMKQLNSIIRNHEGYEYLNYKQFNPQELKSALTNMKRQASLQLKNILLDSIKTANDDKLFSLSESELMGLVNQELGNISVNIHGPSLEELITNIRFQSTSSGGLIASSWYGPKNNKNDSVMIEIRHRDLLIAIKQKLAPKVSNDVMKKIEVLEERVRMAQDDFFTLMQTKIDTHLAQLKKDKDPQKYSKLSKDYIYDLGNLEAQDKELAAARAKIATASRRLRKYIYDAGLERSDWDTLENYHKSVLNSLKNSFIISSTAKSYNTYNNKIGFLGGSLGSNLNMQLLRIQDIFTSAGMPISQDELDWLHSAIINCFPGSVVGEKNKDLIQQYLGAMMAFALFDEGGVESQIIAKNFTDRFDNIKKNNAHGNFLHLYSVNGVYVPGSYVLKKTQQQLDQVINDIQKISAVMNSGPRGAGIVIVNNASESDIVNRPMSKYLNGGADENAWATTGANVESKVSLKILFLAGLLDIVNGINKTLSNVELPT